MRKLTYCVIALLNYLHDSTILWYFTHIYRWSHWTDINKQYGRKLGSWLKQIIHVLSSWTFSACTKIKSVSIVNHIQVTIAHTKKQSKACGSCYTASEPLSTWIPATTPVPKPCVENPPEAGIVACRTAVQVSQIEIVENDLTPLRRDKESYAFASHMHVHTHAYNTHHWPFK